MNFGAFFPGALLNPGIFAFKPCLYRRRALFISPLDRLLWGEASACQILAYAANMQLDAVFLFDELTDGCPAPQKEIHLELLRSFIDSAR